MTRTLPIVAYIAEQRLYVKRPDRAREPIESVFAEQLLERDAERRQRQGWRGGNPLWQLAAGPEQAPVLPPIEEVRPIAFTNVCRAADPGEMLYVLHVGAMGALLHYKLDEAYERRLVHRQQYGIADIAVHPGQDLMVCSLQYDDGSCNLARGDREGRKLVEITGGDSRDESPAWADATGTRVVYQTAGIGRDARGMRAGLGPYRIVSVDLEGGDLRELRRDDRYDYLSPKLAANGDLYCIRRPYEDRPASVGLLTQARDALLFPFRLARAFVHFFNAFSMMFSGKPLYTAGGPRRQGPDAARLMLWGRLIEAQDAERRRTGLAQRPLVPSSWQLCVQRTDGHQEVLASNVVAFDLCVDGAVVYTTGTHVTHRGPDGIETRLDDGRWIHQLAVIG